MQPESGKPGHLENPGGITIDPAGNVWVVDWMANRVIEFNEEGSYLREFDFKGTGSGDGQFKHPDAISVDANGAVWVGDEGNARVQVFNEAGEYITKFGSKGSGKNSSTSNTRWASSPRGMAKSGSPMPGTTAW